MLFPGLDNNGVLAPGVDGFKNLVNDLTNRKVDTVKVKKVMDGVPGNKTTFNLNNVDLVKPLQKMVTDFGLNVNKQNNTIGKHATETPVNLSELIQPLLKPVMDLFETGKPKADSKYDKSKHHKSSHKTTKSQWVYFDRYRILPKPINDFLNGLKLPRFYYLTLRDWTIVQALQIPVAVLGGGVLGASIALGPALLSPMISVFIGLVTPFILGAIIIVGVAAVTILPVAGIVFALGFIAVAFLNELWITVISLTVAVVAGIISGLANAGGGTVIFPIVGTIAAGLVGLAAGFLIGGGIALVLSNIGVWTVGLIIWIVGALLVTAAIMGIILFFTFIVTVIVLAIVYFILILPLSLIIGLIAPIAVVIGSTIFWVLVSVGFIRSLRKPRLLTKHSLDKARHSSHHSKSHHSDKSKSEHSKSKSGKSGKSHHKKKSSNPLDGVNNTLRDILGTNPKAKHNKHHTSATTTTSPRHKVSTVKHVVVDYSNLTGVNNNAKVSKLIGLNQVNAATNISNLSPNAVGVVRIPVTLLSNVGNLLSIPNLPTLLKQDTAGNDNTVCTPSGLVGITCTQVSPTVNENINSAVQEQTQVVPQTTVTTTTNDDGSKTTTTKVDHNKPAKVIPKKVWPLPSTGLMSRIDYFVLQNRATGRHNNLVNTMDTLYGTRRHPGPLRPIAEATAGLVDNI